MTPGAGEKGDYPLSDVGNGQMIADDFGEKGVFT